MPRRITNISEYLWSKVEKTDTCWLWRGRVQNRKQSASYGIIQLRRGGRMLTFFTHRLAYELTHGSIAKGLDVCHTCDTPACVNPQHLFLGTRRDNMRDCVAKGRHCYGIRHPHARFADNDVIAIRRTYSAGGISQNKLARQYGVSQDTIRKIVLGMTWKHISAA